jgi:hypothetical protein
MPKSVRQLKEEIAALKPKVCRPFKNMRKQELVAYLDSLKGKVPVEKKHEVKEREEKKQEKPKRPPYPKSKPPPIPKRKKKVPPPLPPKLKKPIKSIPSIKSIKPIQSPKLTKSIKSKPTFKSVKPVAMTPAPKKKKTIKIKIKKIEEKKQKGNGNKKKISKFLKQVLENFEKLEPYAARIEPLGGSNEFQEISYFSKGMLEEGYGDEDFEGWTHGYNINAGDIKAEDSLYSRWLKKIKTTNGGYIKYLKRWKEKIKKIKEEFKLDEILEEVEKIENANLIHFATSLLLVKEGRIDSLIKSLSHYKSTKNGFGKYS